MEPSDRNSTVDQRLHWRYSIHRRPGHPGSDGRGDSHDRGSGGHRVACRFAVNAHRVASRGHEPTANRACQYGHTGTANDRAGDANDRAARLLDWNPR